MRPLNVLDLRDTYEIGGPGKTILETFRAIDGRQFRLHLGVFLARSEAADSPFIRAARDIGLPVHLIRGWNQFDLRMIHEVAQLTRRLEIDIVHAHEVKSDVITLLASLFHRVRTVTTMHGWIGNGVKQRTMIALDRRVARYFDLTIAVSRRIREELLEAGVPSNRVRVLHNGIVLDRYRRQGQNGYLPDLIGTLPSGIVIVSVGRLSPEKGQADLIDALAIVSSAGVPFTAVFAGDGPSRSALQARIRAHGLEKSVYLPGYIDPPQRLIEAADLLVLPSHTEGLPNAALEALAMKVPVVATKVGGTPEVITDRETGRLVPAAAPDALADAILDFAANQEEWRRTAARGRTMVEARFDFGNRTRQLEELYREVMTGSQ